MGTRRRWLAAVAVALVLAACSGDDSDGGDASVITDPPRTSTSASSTTSSTTSTSVDPDAAVKADVEATYLAQWDAYVEILSAPDPSNPLIDQFYSGASKDAMLDTISTKVLNGEATRRPDDAANFSVNVFSVELTNTGAELRSCVIDGLVVIRRDSGEVLNDAVVTLEFEGHLVNEKGQWKVIEHVVLNREPGRKSCGES